MKGTKMDWSKQDRLVREALEKQSPSAKRIDMAGSLNKMAADDAGRAMPGLSFVGIRHNDGITPGGASMRAYCLG
jgi:hypothetical protein